jgi:hypothetical protein
MNVRIQEALWWREQRKSGAHRRQVQDGDGPLIARRILLHPIFGPLYGHGSDELAEDILVRAALGGHQLEWVFFAIDDCAAALDEGGGTIARPALRLKLQRFCARARPMPCEEDYGGDTSASEHQERRAKQDKAFAAEHRRWRESALDPGSHIEKAGAVVARITGGKRA